MTQTQLDMTNHFGFQLSLMRLSAIPGPNGIGLEENAQREAAKLEALAETVSNSRH